MSRECLKLKQSYSGREPKASKLQSPRWIDDGRMIGQEERPSKPSISVISVCFERAKLTSIGKLDVWSVKRRKFPKCKLFMNRETIQLLDKCNNEMYFFQITWVILNRHIALLVESTLIFSTKPFRSVATNIYLLGSEACI